MYIHLNKFIFTDTHINNIRLRLASADTDDVVIWNNSFPYRRKRLAKFGNRVQNWGSDKLHWSGRFCLDIVSVKNREFLACHWFIRMDNRQPCLFIPEDINTAIYIYILFFSLQDNTDRMLGNELGERTCMRINKWRLLVIFRLKPMVNKRTVRYVFCWHCYYYYYFDVKLKTALWNDAF